MVRLSAYHSQTEPIVAHYAPTKVVEHVDANQGMEKVIEMFSAIVSARYHFLGLGGDPDGYESLSISTVVSCSSFSERIIAFISVSVSDHNVF